jgi:hypothetical protein
MYPIIELSRDQRGHIRSEDDNQFDIRLKRLSGYRVHLARRQTSGYTLSSLSPRDKTRVAMTLHTTIHLDANADADAFCSPDTDVLAKATVGAYLPL